MVISWKEIKRFCESGRFCPSYIELDNQYWIKAREDVFEIECVLIKETEDAIDFEVNYREKMK